MARREFWAKRFQQFSGLALAWSTPGHAQLASGGATPEVDLVRLIAALLFCLIVGLAVIYWMRRRLPIAQRADTGSLRLAETIRLNVKASLHVVEFEGRRWLIASDANGGVTLIAEAARTTADSVDAKGAAG